MLNVVEPPLLQNLIKTIQSQDMLRIALLLSQENVRSILNTHLTNGLYPLHAAVITFNLDIIKMLVDAGADVNAGEDQTAFTIACVHNYIEGVEYFLDKGANMHEENTYMTSLAVVCEYVYLDTLELLMSRGADLSKYDKNNEKSSPLFAAYAGDNEEVFHYLLTHHLDHVKSSRDFIFVRTCRHGYQDDLCEVLISRYGANVNMYVKDSSTGKDTPLLHDVVKTNETNLIPVIEVLLKHGVDKTAVDDYGLTALDWAKERNNKDLIEVLS